MLGVALGKGGAALAGDQIGANGRQIHRLLDDGAIVRYAVVFWVDGMREPLLHVLRHSVTIARNHHMFVFITPKYTPCRRRLG